MGGYTKDATHALLIEVAPIVSNDRSVSFGTLGLSAHPPYACSTKPDIITAFNYAIGLFAYDHFEALPGLGAVVGRVHEAFEYHNVTIADSANPGGGVHPCQVEEAVFRLENSTFLLPQGNGNGVRIADQQRGDAFSTGRMDVLLDGDGTVALAL